MPPSDSGRHDFSTDQAGADEKRLHLLAFDYWHGLKGAADLPLFQQLSPGGLAPYRSNTLLLEFAGDGAIVRFIGEKVGILIDAPISAGSNLTDFPHSTFAQALIGQFNDRAGRKGAAEFEFVEDLLDCRGIMLPFSRDGQYPHFVMVVTNFRRRHVPEDLVTSKALEARLSTSMRAARSVVHLDGGNRDSLYQALEQALALFEEGELNSRAWKALLKKEGLKSQSRARFTPALKLTFGKDYDKTRLTEYASALAYARSKGQHARGLAEFLKSVPGGIKGCVQLARAQRRAYRGDLNVTEAALMAARTLKPVKLKDIHPDTEFCLILGRRNKDGGTDAIALADLGPGVTESAIKKLRLKQQQQQ